MLDYNEPNKSAQEVATYGYGFSSHESQHFGETITTFSTASKVIYIHLFVLLAPNGQGKVCKECSYCCCRAEGTGIEM